MPNDLMRQLAGLMAGIQPAHHEQSRTIQRPDGMWINIYGPKTPLAGKPLPREYSFEQDQYATREEAERAAQRRSIEHGRIEQWERSTPGVQIMPLPPTQSNGKRPPPLIQPPETFMKIPSPPPGVRPRRIPSPGQDYGDRPIWLPEDKEYF